MSTHASAELEPASAYFGFRTPCRYRLTRFVFLRALGVLYFFSFLTLVNQWRPLLGSHGLLPVVEFLAHVRAELGSTGAGFWRLPSLFWFGSSDGFFMACAWLGLALALVVTLGFANAPIMAVLWLLHLSFVKVGQIFYGYGWESLLAETGFLAIFLVPGWSPRPFVEPVPWPVVVLLRWLTFRVMFGAGLIKIRGDSCWSDLTCLFYHFETQPLPGPLSAAFHRLPHRLLEAGVVFNHFAELVAPFGVFGPRRVRLVAGIVIIVFQLTLIASGNLSYLNWLTVVVALSCFDDGVFQYCFPKRFRRAAPAEPLPRVRRNLTVALCVLVGVLSINPVVNLLSPRQAMNASFDPFDLVNTYGAFGSVNRERDEVVLEGTWDTGPDAHWLELELPCKPGDPERRPCVVAPYQYKLDWQLWFAAFERPEQQPWLIHLVYKLLRGDHEIDALFARQPFHERAPLRVRALYYRYEFAPHASRAYWQRELLGVYLRPLSLEDPFLQSYLRRAGWAR
ncbi:MAG TPA: lipase maturation factor family protein [Polyangiaceae bacterium]|jgi:hypothetical protein